MGVPGWWNSPPYKAFLPLPVPAAAQTLFLTNAPHHLPFLLQSLQTPGSQQNKASANAKHSHFGLTISSFLVSAALLTHTLPQPVFQGSFSPWALTSSVCWRSHPASPATEQCLLQAQCMTPPAGVTLRWGDTNHGTLSRPLPSHIFPSDCLQLGPSLLSPLPTPARPARLPV